jgi:hypothetical protein
MIKKGLKMKLILIVFMIFINLYAKNPYQVVYDKNNPEHVKELDTVQETIIKNLGNRLDKFKNQYLRATIELNVIENGKYYFKIIKYSNNKEYDKTIQNFINEENGKIYYINPKFLRVRIDLKPI